MLKLPGNYKVDLDKVGNLLFHVNKETFKVDPLGPLGSLRKRTSDKALSKPFLDTVVFAIIFNDEYDR